MPHHLFDNLPTDNIGAILTSIGGAVLRHAIGPGWSWSEVCLASVTGVVFAIWMAPAIVAYFGFGPEMYGALCWVGGMLGLPIMRGVITLVVAWSKNPKACIAALAKMAQGFLRGSR